MGKLIINEGIDIYDGYKGEPIWDPQQYSTYCNPVVDNQCELPLDDYETIIKNSRQ